MFSGTLTELVTQVIKSWQVIVVTIVLVLFMYMVNYVGRSYHRPLISKSKPKKKKAEKKPEVKKPTEDEVEITEQ